MEIRNLFKDDKGSALPFVTLILGLFALGFIALVIDAGILYSERKAMITSADAAALAGADVLRETQGSNIEEAKTIALNYAVANGADEDQVQITVGNKEVILPSGSTEARQVVDVSVGINKQAIFARFLGSDETDVKAQAVATWGYIKKAYVGNFIPLFIFDENYETNVDKYLHEKIDGTNGYGFINIGGGMGAIKEAIAGTSVGGSYIYNNLLDGKPGNGASLLGAVEDRMEMAQKKPTAVERQNAMIGLVPIIDKEAFKSISSNTGTNVAHWQLPIKYFAYFEIKDVIKQNTIKGSEKALNPDNEYKPIGTAINYTGKIPEDLLKDKKDKVENVVVLGRFTGEIVDARTIAEAGDQVNPNPGGEVPATYSKLIE